MKKLNQILAIIILFIVTTPGITAQNNSKTNLWKIEGEDIKTSYLFGTIHIIPKKDFIIKDKVQKAFDASDKVVLEIDMADPNFATEAVQLSMLKENEELKSYMTDKEYKILDDHLKEKKGIGVDNFNKFKPIMLMSMLLTTGNANEPLESYEISLINMSKAAKKEVDGLETYADQLKAFDADPYDEQLDALVDMVENIEETEKLYNELLAYYLDEDVDGMFNFMDEYMHQDTEAIKRFLDDRNNNWIPRITEYSKEESVFYAIGGAHLGGEQGVISLLRKAGYTVTPIMD